MEIKCTRQGPSQGLSDASLAVGAYTVGITVVISGIGAGVGTIFGFVDDYSTQFRGIVQLVAGSVIVVLGVSMMHTASSALA